MMRKKFDEQLAALNRSLIKMGAICEEAIALAAKALTQGKKELADKIEALSQELEDMEHEVENLCIKLLLQQQPVAGDMRHISAALKMVTDMKRIGVQAEDIAEIIKVMKSDLHFDLRLIDDMARATVKMVTDSTDAFVRQNAELAEKTIADDDTVDDYFLRVRKQLI
ncbi:MAG: phosphate signaling complex protein PhoU, partial [Candidatus Limivicinus sp.]